MIKESMPLTMSNTLTHLKNHGMHRPRMEWTSQTLTDLMLPSKASFNL